MKEFLTGVEGLCSNILFYRRVSLNMKLPRKMRESYSSNILDSLMIIGLKDKSDFEGGGMMQVTKA